MENKLESKEMREMAAVLEHPDHKTGLEEGEWVITDSKNLSSTFARVYGRLEGFSSAAAWKVPNCTLRIEIPESNDVVEGINTTSRVYTVAEVSNSAAGLSIAVDMVRHVADSPVMRWLRSLTPGERVVVKGPRPHQLPIASTATYLFADASALPAVRSILRNGVVEKPTVIIDAPTTDARDYLVDVLDTAEFVFLDNAETLVDAFAALRIAPTDCVWAAGERDDMREIRRRAREEVGVVREGLRVFGYWKKDTSHTWLDIVRLRAAHERLAQGKGPLDADDFDLDI